MDINSFLKEKEAESTADLSSMNDHWMNMQKVLLKENLLVHHTGTIVNPAVIYLTLASLISLCFLVNIISAPKSAAIDYIKPAPQKPALNNTELPPKEEHATSVAKDSSESSIKKPNSTPQRYIPSSGKDSIPHKSRKRMAPSVKEADSQKHPAGRRYRQ